ncbi:META domain-containing protein [Hymenobacter sp.]|uniref:META domain-containing protein n=1 Tax=Hymenobacter sp. TaxID=1898978 RepID=UPI00286AE638|nr:META domain-containing protein [Hymenobacter sp.]
MSLPACLRLASAALATAIAGCSFNPAERPNAGPGANAVERTAPGPSPLRNVRWELRELAGRPAPTLEQTPYLVLREGRTRVEGRAGCNKFSGPYIAPAGGALRLGPLATTRSACPDLAAEGAFLRALNQAQHYRISGTTLSLYAADTLGTPLARLAATPEE